MNRKKITILILLIAADSLLYSCTKKESSPIQSAESTGIIDADNSNIQYVGRFDHSNPKNVRFDWSGVYIRAKFEGTSCSIRLKDSANFYAVTIDTQATQVLQIDTALIYSVAENLADTVHSILIEKRTEAFVGVGEFSGFILDKGKTLVALDSIPTRRIEYIGNSITCGYGVEGENASAPFKPETENATLSYAALVGRALNADYATVSYSGKGVVRNYGDSVMTSADPLPRLYNRTICTDSTLTWDFTGWIPQVVVINLGTNDFSTQPHPTKTIFQDAYSQLIDRVQAQYSGVTIFCICGPMIGAPCSNYIEEVVNQCQQNNTNKEVYYIGINTNLLTIADRGSDWHPNVSGQQKIAGIVLPVIQNTMNW